MINRESEAYSGSQALFQNRREAGRLTHPCILRESLVYLNDVDRDAALIAAGWEWFPEM